MKTITYIITLDNLVYILYQLILKILNEHIHDSTFIHEVCQHIIFDNG